MSPRAPTTANYDVSADVGKTLKAMKKVEGSFWRAHKAMHSLVKKSKKLDSNLSASQKGLNRITSSLKSYAFGYLGAQGAIAATKAFTGALDEGVQKAMTFEDEMTAVLSLGENTKNIENIKNAVLDLSSASGIVRKDVADAFFNIQSNASSLGKSVQDNIITRAVQMKKVLGADLALGITNLSKAMLIYGADLGTVERAQSKMSFTADRAAATMEDFSNLLADILPNAKAFGFTFDEVMGTIAVATQKGGKNTRTFTQLRNMFLLLGKAADEGLVTAASGLNNMMEELQKLEASDIGKVFGQENVTVVLNLRDSLGLLAEATREVSEVQDEFVAGKFSDRLKDQAFAYTELSKSIEQTYKNTKLLGGATEGAYAGFKMTQGVGKIGAAEVFPNAPEIIHDIMGLSPRAKKRGGEILKRNKRMADVESSGLDAETLETYKRLERSMGLSVADEFLADRAAPPPAFDFFGEGERREKKARDLRIKGKEEEVARWRAKRTSPFASGVGPVRFAPGHEGPPLPIEHINAMKAEKKLFREEQKQLQENNLRLAEINKRGQIEALDRSLIGASQLKNDLMKKQEQQLQDELELLQFKIGNQQRDAQSEKLLEGNSKIRQSRAMRVKQRSSAIQEPVVVN